MTSRTIPTGVVIATVLIHGVAIGTAAAPQKPAASSRNATPKTSVSTPVPSDYRIGPDDILTIFFWREKDLTGDVAVRPDGRISLPLLNDIEASGLTPEELRLRITAAAEDVLQDPNVTVVVKQINSRRVYITGQISKPGPYSLGGPMSVMQLIAMAGGILEYADEKNIIVMRTVNGRPTGLKFNYDEVKRGRNLEQDISLKPGDTVIVP